MGRLTTHVLDTSRGRPGEGLDIELFRIDGEARVKLGAFRTNADGRCDQPLLEGTEFAAGIYELVFDAGAYFAVQGAVGGGDLPEPGFLGKVPVRFGISAADAHYHVPLLLSPFGYSTYRGS